MPVEAFAVLLNIVEGKSTDAKAEQEGPEHLPVFRSDGVSGCRGGFSNAPWKVGKISSGRREFAYRASVTSPLAPALAIFDSSDPSRPRQPAITHLGSMRIMATILMVNPGHLLPAFVHRVAFHLLAFAGPRFCRSVLVVILVGRLAWRRNRLSRGSHTRESFSLSGVRGKL